MSTRRDSYPAIRRAIGVIDHESGRPIGGLSGDPRQVRFIGFGLTYREAELEAEQRRYRDRKAHKKSM